MVKAKLNTIFSVLFLVMVISLAGCSAQVKEAPVKMVDSFLVVKDVALARADVEAVGGEVNHIFPADNVLIGKVPLKFKSKYVSKVYYERDSIPKELSVVFNAWTKNLEWKRMPLKEKMSLVDTDIKPPFDDMIWEETPDLSKLKDLPDRTLPNGGDPGDTSLFAIGDYAVSIITPESISGSEDWTSQELSDVYAEIINGLDWWIARNPDADLTFVYNYEEQVPIASEPIEGNGLGGWIIETMNSLGYSSSYPGLIYDYINDLRNEMNTDWGFVLFVVDSSNDVDGKFSDGKFAFTVMNNGNGGVYSVMTYDNAGYGISQMDSVVAHETGHIFGALDQYFPCSCDSVLGYLNYENQNCENTCLIDEPSIMKELSISFPSGLVDEYARGQIGWQDTDEDGYQDIVDMDPRVSITDIWMYPGYYYAGDGYSWTSIFNAINPNYNNVSINKIESIEHRYALNPDLNYGDWIGADYISVEDPYSPIFNFSSPILGMGSYGVQFRATNNFGMSTSESFYNTQNPLIAYGCIDLENGAYNFDGIQFNNETNYCVDESTFRDYSCSGNDIVYEDILCAGGCFEGVCQASLIRNPSFELDTGVDFYPGYIRDDNILGNLIPDGWNTYHSTGIMDSSTAQEGSYSVKVSPGSASQVGNMNQFVPVEMGKTYKVSGWMKVDSECQADPDCKATLGLHCQLEGDISQWNCPIDVADWPTVNELDWTYVESEFLVEYPVGEIPDTTHLEIACYNSPHDYSVDSGYVWCDAFNLEEVLPPVKDKPGKKFL